MMYDKLLVTTGGGILNDAQLADQDGNATIIIGLGGTGVDCLRLLKRKVYTRLKPDNFDDKTHMVNGVPKFDHIKFLAVDTDAVAMKKTADIADGTLGELTLATEFFDISYSSSIKDLFTHKAAQLAKNPMYKEWLQYAKIDAATADVGAGGIRQLGRYLTMEKASAFVSKVTALISAAKAGLGSCKTNIYIISGMGGGTGSGTFLDMCYLTRKAIQTSGVTAHLAGLFFLPDVNLAKAGLSTEVQQYIQENGYAAMQELDYCMNFGTNGGEWRQYYGDALGEVSYKISPVDMCHIIAGALNGGAKVVEPYDYAMNAAADYMMDFLAKPAADKFTLDSHYSNIASIKAHVSKPSGGCYDYVVLGSACAVVPFRQLLTYLASQVFAQFGDLPGRCPSDEDMASFAKETGFDFGVLERQLLGGVDATFPPTDAKAKDVIVSHNLVVDHFAELRAKADGKIKTNVAALCADVKSYAGAVASDGLGAASLIAKVLDRIRGVMADPKRGPMYARELLDGTSGKDLRAVCQGIRKQAQEQYDFCAYNLNRPNGLYESCRQREEKFDKSGLGRGAALRAWQDIYKQRCQLEVQAEVYSQLVKLMDVVMDQLKALRNRFVDPFAATVGALLSTFAANASQLTTFQDGANPYEQPLLSMGQIMASPAVKNAVANIDADQTMRNLLVELLSEEGLKGWGPDGSESVLCAMVSSYFQRLYSGFTGRTIDEFLADKYGIQAPDKLAAKVCSNLLGTLDANSQALFWNGIGYDVAANASTIAYLTVPDSSPVLIAAAQQMAKAHPNDAMQVREVGVNDRISVLRCYAGVPMWGYNGVGQYASVGLHSTRPGVHLYEQAEYVAGASDKDEVRYSRNWSHLPSPVPISQFDDHPDPLLQSRANDVKHLFQQGIAAGVIDHDETTDTYTIRRLDAAFFGGIQQKYQAVAGDDIAPDMKIEARQGIQETMNNPEYSMEHPTLGTGHDIALDNFASAPELQEMALEAMAEWNTINQMIEKLTPKVDTDLKDFVEAIAAQVITLDIPVIQYEDQEFGDTTVLSKPHMEFDGTPLYQAYRQFKALGAGERDAMRGAVADLLDQNPKELLRQGCGSLLKELGRKKDYVFNANANYPEQTAEVKELLRDMQARLDSFMSTYAVER